jgi:Tfp pilus assembly protein PilF
MEKEIALAVARSVRAALTPGESARLARQAPTIGAAQQAYLEGVSYLAQNRRGPEIRPALEALQRAIALDPTFAPPHAAAARAYVLLGFDGEIPQAEAYVAARAAAHRALALDPELADAHAALADVSFYYEWDWAAGEAEYVRAIDLAGSGSYARTRYAHLLAAAGRTDEARQQADQAVSIDPLTADVTLTAGLMAYYQRRYDEARDILRRVTVMDPRFPGAYRTLARIEEARGDFAAALDLTDRSIRLADRPISRAAALRLRALAGQTTLARQGLTQLKARLAAEQRSLDAPYEAYVRLALGEREAALELLSKAVEARDPAVLWMAVDPRLDPLRTDPRFQALLTRLGRP